MDTCYRQNNTLFVWFSNLLIFADILYSNLKWVLIKYKKGKGGGILDSFINQTFKDSFNNSEKNIIITITIPINFYNKY